MALPLPRVISDIGPGGGVATAMNGLNELGISHAKAQYAPWNEYANALKNMAMAQFAGPQAIAGILNSPAARYMSGDQANALTGSFQRMLSQQAGNMNRLPVPGATGNGLLGLLMSKMGGGQQPNSMPMQQGPMPQQSGSGAPANALMAPPQQDQSNPPGYSQGSPAGPLGQAGQQAQGLTVPGTQGGLNPNAGAEAQEAGIKTKVTNQEANAQSQWQQREDKLNQEAQAAVDIGNRLSELREANKNLEFYQAGPGFGRLHPYSNAASNFDTAARNIATLWAKSYQQGHITDSDLEAAGGIKPSRVMPEQSRKDEIGIEEAMQKRLLERQQFMNSAKSRGFYPSDADLQWTRFANENPVIDPETGKVSSKKGSNWDSYLTQQSLNESRSDTYRKKMEEYRKNMFGGNAKRDKKLLDKYGPATSVVPQGRSEDDQGYAETMNSKIPPEEQKQFEKQYGKIPNAPKRLKWNASTNKLEEAK